MKSQIIVEVELAEDNMPENIAWIAPDGGVKDWQNSKAILLGLWNGEAKEAARIDLWTTKMLVNEMNDFYFQTFMGMADTYLRATKNEALTKELKAFAKVFHQKANDALEAAEK